MSARNKAVLISDIHFTVPTLDLASRALRAAFQEADSLDVPLVIAGDTLDSKAIMRGECVNALLEIIQEGKSRPYILVGNHDLIHEKGTEHTLNFLRPYATVIDRISYVENVGAWLVPYQSDTMKLQEFLNDADTQGDLVIMHQGVQTADMGHYQIDKTSLPKEAFRNHRVISGHYHRAQDIKCGTPRKGAVGLFSYIGNPYTLSFGEADHPAKGYQILGSDGLLTPVPLNLRKHCVLDLDISYANDPWPKQHFNKDDLLWVKVRGSQMELAKLDKKELGLKLFGHSNFKLDKIPTDAPKFEVKSEKLSGEQILDRLIDGTDEKPAEKKALKALWREVLE